MENGRLLLVRYYYPEENAWYWNFPGGTLEPGETLEEALKRELMEECSVEVEVGPMVLKEAPPGRDYVRYFFRCWITKGTPAGGNRSCDQRLHRRPMESLVRGHFAAWGHPLRNPAPK